MLQKENLDAMKVDELRKLFKDNGISYYKNSKRMTKSEMIKRYLEVMETKEEKKPFELPDATINKINETERLERKKKYVEQAKIGDIVAFNIPDGRVISAAITKKSSNGRKFLVETKYGAEYKISFDDVLWVRTNKRWPKGIYQLFKKNIKVEVPENGEEIS